MSLIVVHLRWDDVDQEQYDALRRALPDGEQRDIGCLMRQRRRQGRAVLATVVWADGRSADEFLSGLPGLLGPAGLGEPHRAVFAVPACFAAGYRVVPSRARASTADAPGVPAPRVGETAGTPLTHAGRS